MRGDRAGGLACRRGRAGGGAAEGALRAAGLCHRAGAGRQRHRLGPLDRRRRSRPRGAPGGARGLAGQGRRPRHGGRRHAAQGGAGAVPRLSGRQLGGRGGGGAARARASDRRRGERRRLQPVTGRIAGARRALRRRQSGADAGAAVAHHRLCRSGRREPYPRAAEIRRRQVRQRHCLSCRGHAARQGAASTTAAARCTRPATSRSTAGRARSGCSSGSPISRRRKAAVVPTPATGRRRTGSARGASPDPSPPGRYC